MSTMTRLPWKTIEDGMRAAWIEHELWVSFEGGSTYKFEGVPKRFYTDMRNAAKPRRYFRAHIMGRFNYERLETS